MSGGPGGGAPEIGGPEAGSPDAGGRQVGGPEDGGIAREEFEREFGAPGVENPNVLDLIEAGQDGTVSLVMRESRPWGGYEQLRQLEEKINRYLGYVLDGFLVEQHPEHEGHPVRIRLECRDEPSGDAVDFLGEARAAIEGAGVAFEIRVGVAG